MNDWDIILGDDGYYYISHLPCGEQAQGILSPRNAPGYLCPECRELVPHKILEKRGFLEKLAKLHRPKIKYSDFYGPTNVYFYKKKFYV